MQNITGLLRSFITTFPTECQQFVRYKSLIRVSSMTSIMSTGKDAGKCKVLSIDHFVLTVADIDKSIKFYTNVLGMTSIQFGEGRKALQFGNQKINLHQARREFKPHAKRPTPGSADLCFVTEQSLSDWVSRLQQLGIKVEEGPVSRTGAVGPMNSVYVRDPDENLVEIAYYGK